ncbi:MAG: hypothetical protein FRX49_06004 [Trebouxia sp. A1-2]|nr:MAG: hypothetical protein FRX49_06004 [Trebouxia sp. A1-2]
MAYLNMMGLIHSLLVPSAGNQRLPKLVTIVRGTITGINEDLQGGGQIAGDFSILVMLLRPQLWQMETALADHAVEKLMRGPTSTTAVAPLVCPKRVVGVVNSGSKPFRNC